MFFLIHLLYLNDVFVFLAFKNLCFTSCSSWQANSIQLPSSVFASEFEEEVGLLNKAAPISGKLNICRLQRLIQLDNTQT